MRAHPIRVPSFETTVSTIGVPIAISATCRPGAGMGQHASDNELLLPDPDLLLVGAIRFHALLEAAGRLFGLENDHAVGGTGRFVDGPVACHEPSRPARTRHDPLAQDLLLLGCLAIV